MIDLGPLADLGLLDLAEITHLGVGVQVGPRSQPGIGTNSGTFRDMRAFEVREGMDHSTRFDRHARTKNDIGLDQRILTDHRIEGEEDSFRRDHRYAVDHQFMAAALLPEVFDKGQFGAVVAADQFCFRCIDGDGAAAERPGNFDHVRQIIFALHIAVADPVEQIKGIAAIDRHQSTIAPGHPALFVGRILFLADRHQLAILDQQPAITRGPIGMKTDHRDIGAGSNGLAGPVERGGGNERHVAISDDEIVEAAFDCRTCGKHGMAGTFAFRLKKSLNLKSRQARRRGNIVGVTSDDERHRAHARSSHRLDHMRNHRTAGDRMQHPVGDCLAADTAAHV